MWIVSSVRISVEPMLQFFRDYLLSCLRINPTLLFLTDNIEYQPKSNEEYITFLHCISSFEGTSYKNLYDTATISFYFLMFLLDFTSGDKRLWNIL